MIAGTSSRSKKKAVLGCSVYTAGSAGRASDMSTPVAAPVPSAVCPGDPETFASEMIKLINDKEFRFAKRLLCCVFSSVYMTAACLSFAVTYVS